MFENDWPNLKPHNREITSGQTPDYNCVAWSVGKTLVWIWPDDDMQYAWPITIPRNESVDAFIRFYATIGYQVCGNADLEVGYEKVAIYVDGQDTTHVARQLDTGHWTSKLGDLVDIRHNELSNLADGIYGTVARVVRRLRGAKHPELPELYPQPALIL